MNYIYDIFLNFDELYYEFYDWNPKDQITHIRKIPIFKINSLKLNEIKNNKVKFEKDFLDKIKNKCEYYVGRNIKIIEYAFLLTDGNEVIALKLNPFKYSSLQIEEELDVLDSLRFKECDFNYEIIDSNKYILFKTRHQIEVEKIVKRELIKLNKEDNMPKIRYLYYECFNKKENDKDKILKKLNNSLKNKEIMLKLIDFFEVNKLTFN